MKRTNEGWGAVLPVIDQQNPIIQYASSTSHAGECCCWIVGLRGVAG